MKKIDLTAQEKLNLERRHKRCKDSRESDRIKAILLRSEGWTLPMISQALRLHEATIAHHINDFGSGKLQPENGGSQSHLTDMETQELLAHLTEHTYHFGYEIVAYIQERYGITYSIPGLNKWLHRHGFSYKKPKGHPHKADKEKQAAFIEHYQQLKATVASDEVILFMDSVHPSQATKITHGWIKKGTEKHINTSASRTRLNIVGGIELSNLSAAITADYNTINSDSIIDFMQRVRNNYQTSSTVHLILDCAGYHRAQTVAEQAKNLNIQLHFLPPYSPNLNPIERLWKVMNEKVRDNRFFKNPAEFRQSIEHFFKNILPDIADKLGSRINDNFQRLKPAS
jgi:transposase